MNGLQARAMSGAAVGSVLKSLTSEPLRGSLGAARGAAFVLSPRHVPWRTKKCSDNTEGRLRRPTGENGGSNYETGSREGVAKSTTVSCTVCSSCGRTAPSPLPGSPSPGSSP